MRSHLPFRESLGKLAIGTLPIAIPLVRGSLDGRAMCFGAFADIEPLMKQTLAWMRNDVRVCFQHHANVAAFNLICCYTDALAGFLEGTEKDRPDDYRVRFTTFFRRYFVAFGQNAASIQPFHIRYPREQDLPERVDCFDAFSQLYRNGLAHEFMQKSGSLITRTSDDGDRPYLAVSENPAGIPDPDGGRTKRLNIHLDHLFNDFMNAVGLYEYDLFADPRTTRPHHDAALRRFNFLLR